VRLRAATPARWLASGLAAATLGAVPVVVSLPDVGRWPLLADQGPFRVGLHGQQVESPDGTIAAPPNRPGASQSPGASASVAPAAPGSGNGNGTGSGGGGYGGGSGGAGGSVCGTWAMLQVSTPQALHYFSPQVNQALAMPGVAGLSLRAPWTSITSNLAIFDAGMQLTQADHSQLAIRFVSGQDTPAADLGNSTVLQGNGGGRIPIPWGATATPTSFIPNTTFESAFAATARQLAAYARSHGIHELHLPWYSGPSAEVYDGPEIQNAAGYSPQNFLAGYERLLDIGMSVAGNGVTVEFPLSGIGTGQFVRPLEAYAASHYAGRTGQLVFQWNDLTASAGAVSAQGLQTGRQMIGQGDYDWQSVYQTLRREGSISLEVYLQSFATSLAHYSSLRQQVASFASTC
jgi:hypothetical protein